MVFEEQEMVSQTTDTKEFDRAAFERDGFLVKKGFADPSVCDDIMSISVTQLNDNLAPIEYEVDVQYPGSPVSKFAEGGDTCRRLLHAYARDELYRQWATNDACRSVLEDLFRGESSASVA